MRDIAVLVARRQSTYYISGEENKEDDNDNDGDGGHNMIAVAPCLLDPSFVSTRYYMTNCASRAACVYCVCRCLPRITVPPIDPSDNSQSISRRCFAARTKE